jgi:hygromycin-B 7''-O-kinase
MTPAQEDLPPPVFATKREYGEVFTKPEFWRPYLDRIAHRHGLSLGAAQEIGVPGTHPVFLSDAEVVKIFSPLFDGGASWRIEKEMYERLERETAIPAPRVLASGQLFEGELNDSWPYLILSRIPGRSVGEDRDRLTEADWGTALRSLGRTIRALHSLPVRDFPALGEERGSFRDHLEAQREGCIERHRSWGALPERLIRQIPDYLPPTEDWIAEPPVVLHADLTEDHLLGKFIGGAWKPAGLIDFGDARIGDPTYEWVALHFGMLRCDPKSLRLFLNSYYGEEKAFQFDPKRLMSYALLHEFDLFSSAFDWRPELKDALNWMELETHIWMENHS